MLDRQRRESKKQYEAANSFLNLEKVCAWGGCGKQMTKREAKRCTLFSTFPRVDSCVVFTSSQMIHDLTGYYSLF